MKRNSFLVWWIIFVAVIYLIPWWNRVYFLWDDLELLMLLKFQFWKSLFLAHQYQFFPIFQLLYWLELQLFGVKPSLFFLVSVILHLVNIFLASSLTFRLTKSKVLSMLTAILVSFNKSFFEGIFWPTLQSNILLTTCALFSLHLFFKVRERYRNRDAWILFFTFLIENFVFGFGVSIGFVSALTALIFFKPGTGRKIIPLLGVTAGIIGVSLILLFSVPELHRDGIPIFISATHIFDILYFTAAGLAEGIISRFFLPGFVPDIYSMPNIFIMILIPGALAVMTIFLIFRSIMKKTWKRQLQPLFMFYSLVAAPYAIAALARSVNGTHKALADRYVYFPLFLFVLAVVYSLFLCKKSGILRGRNNIFIVVTFSAALIIAIGHLVAMSFQANLLFL